MEQAAGKHPYKRMRLTKLENLQLKENNHVICCTVQPKTIIPAYCQEESWVWTWCAEPHQPGHAAWWWTQHCCSPLGAPLCPGAVGPALLHPSTLAPPIVNIWAPNWTIRKTNPNKEYAFISTSQFLQFQTTSRTERWTCKPNVPIDFISCWQLVWVNVEH